MRNSIQVSRRRLINNYDIFTALCGLAAVAPVLKSNAYGHGFRETYGIIAGERSPAWICVNYPFEAAELRALGFGGRILIVGPVGRDELQTVCDADADMVLGHAPLLAAWKNSPARPRIHVKFDTGMSRQGFWPDQAPSLAAELKPFRDKVQGIATHFANVEDVLHLEYALGQLRAFDQAVQDFASPFPALLRHSASSASALLLPASRLDLCRVGISLYGQWPSGLTRMSYLQQNQALPALQPALKWVTEVDSVKEVPRGMFIGYGCTFRAPQRMVIAVLPVGYFEGFPRLAGENHSFVLLRGSRCQIMGRICMNMMMVDVSHLEGVRAGEPVTLIGEDGDETISGADLGSKSRTIDYEILTRLNGQIPRQVVD